MNEKITTESLLKHWVTSKPDISFVASNNTYDELSLIKQMDISKKSVLGCVCLNYGYVLCGNKHIRLLGGKNDNCLSLFDVNELNNGHSVIKNILIVADTSDGGIFALNCNRDTGAEIGEILYLPSRSLIWEPLGIGYADFVKWALMSTESDLLSNGWIDNGMTTISLNRTDSLLIAKICVLQSFGKRSEIPNDR